MAKIQYIDPYATGTGDGTSWENARTTLSFSGLAAGDIVEISGGPAGGTVTYDLDALGRTYSEFTYLSGFKGGVLGNPVTYRIGQDAGHNGKAIFKTAKGGNLIANGTNSRYVVISGDAGDGGKHFSLTGFTALFAFTGDSGPKFAQYIDISHFDCGEIKRVGTVNKGLAINVSHIYAKINDLLGSTCIQWDSLGSSWGINSIHHCHFVLPTSGNGTGTDGIAGGAGGTDIYNNLFESYIAEFNPSGQHQDGIQALGGSYFRWYNNEFVNIANYPVFLKAYTGDFSHGRVYNNLMRLTNATIRASSPPQGISIGVGSADVVDKLGRWPFYTDLVVANNTIVDYGGLQAIAFRNTYDWQHAVYDDTCICKNNVGINSGEMNLEPIIDDANNVRINAADAAGYFANYVPYAETGNDFHPLVGAALIVGIGTDLSTFFTTDAEDNLREAPWSAGVFIAGTPPTAVAPTITLQPLTQSATLAANVLLTITAAGVPSPTYQWEKDGAPIAGATASSLALAGVQPSDAASYTCVATNSEGSATSDAAVLTVIVPTPDPEPGAPSVGIYRFAANAISNPMVLLPAIALLFLCAGCSTFRLPRIAVPGATVTAPKNAGKPATMDSNTVATEFAIPAGATLTVEKLAAVPASPKTETSPAALAQPAKEVRTWTFPAASAYVEHAQKVLATTGTIDTSVAMHAADNAERRILLWVAIGAAVAFVVLRGLVPAWPILSNSAGLIAALAFASWKFSEVPEWILVAVAAVAILGALFYKRGEWDTNKNGIPDVLERKTTNPEPAKTS